jgi:hypothetical protein
MLELNSRSTAPSIFLCHASEDKGVVRELYYRLREAGIQPWIDEEDLLPGQQWQEVIREAVQAARIVVVCLSRKSIDKRGFVQVEIQYALDVAAKKTGSYYVVPTRLEPCDIPATWVRQTPAGTRRRSAGKCRSQSRSQPMFRRPRWQPVLGGSDADRAGSRF